MCIHMEQKLDVKEALATSVQLPTERYKVTIESTQKCLNLNITARDDDNLEDAANLAIDGFLYTKHRLEQEGFVVAPMAAVIGVK